MVIESDKLSFPDVFKCGLCDSDNLFLRAYVTVDGGFEYTNVSCGNCRATLTFGQQKKNKDTFYLRKNESGAFDWKAYEQKKDDSNG